MKIAMPHVNGMVNAHFGQTKEFAVFETAGGKVTGKKIVSNNGLNHNHEGLAGLLKSEGIDVVIAGGIGRPMIGALQSAGFKVITGVSGKVDRVAGDFLSGQLATNPAAICGCGDHGHQYGHGHGHHHGHGNC